MVLLHTSENLRTSKAKTEQETFGLMEPNLLESDVLEKVIFHPAGCRHSFIIVLNVRDVGVEGLACMVAYVNPCLNSIKSQLTEQNIKMPLSSQGQVVL